MPAKARPWASFAYKESSQVGKNKEKPDETGASQKSNYKCIKHLKNVKCLPHK